MGYDAFEVVVDTVAARFGYGDGVVDGQWVDVGSHGGYLLIYFFEKNAQ